MQGAVSWLTVPLVPIFQLIHDLQIEIEEFGEDFVFLGFWKKVRSGKEVLTSFMFLDDLNKADLQDGERVEPMQADELLAQLQIQQNACQQER